ncbi:MAG: hypothetical protein ACK5AZ_18955 [Bryobacteraceae bacterium]
MTGECIEAKEQEFADEVAHWLRGAAPTPNQTFLFALHDSRKARLALEYNPNHGSDQFEHHLKKRFLTVPADGKPFSLREEKRFSFRRK